MKQAFSYVCQQILPTCPTDLTSSLLQTSRATTQAHTILKIAKRFNKKSSCSLCNKWYFLCSAFLSFYTRYEAHKMLIHCHISFCEISIQAGDFLNVMCSGMTPRAVIHPNVHPKMVISKIFSGKNKGLCRIITSSTDPAV